MTLVFHFRSPSVTSASTELLEEVASERCTVAGRMTREECKCLQELTEGIDAEQLEDLSVTSFIGLTVGSCCG